MSKGLEIEKKYLIAYPDVTFLIGRGATVKEMEQTYLLCDEGSERVRSTTINGRTEYTHTVKKKIRGIIRKEDEERVSKDEYKRLLLRADPACVNIKKTRYVLDENGFRYEFDVFPFWKDKAFLEVELESEDQEVVLPDFVVVLEDVSEDKRYTNHALARALKEGR
ncbi:MAG: hypothetical protein J5781_08280 [Clostridia bacterium]|nr:hypothetical protein [Clostridia bacterium]